MPHCVGLADVIRHGRPGGPALVDGVISGALTAMMAGPSRPGQTKENWQSSATLAVAGDCRD